MVSFLQGIRYASYSFEKKYWTIHKSDFCMRPITKEVQDFLKEALKDVRLWAILVILIAIWVFIMQSPV